MDMFWNYMKLVVMVKSLLPVTYLMRNCKKELLDRETGLWRAKQDLWWVDLSDQIYATEPHIF